MSLQEFYKRVRLGQSVLTMPRSVQSDSRSLPPEELARMIDRADLWLTPGIVRGYSTEDFPFLKPRERDELDRAVNRFREIADEVPPDGPATGGQATEARSAFETILKILTPSHYAEAESWIAAKVLDRYTESPYCPDEVESIFYKFDADSTGETALSIWVILKDGVSTSPTFRETTRRIEERLRNWLIMNDVDYFPYVHFRSSSEQHRLQGVGAP